LQSFIYWKMSVTREKIIELGENLIRTKGYNAFSYQDISSELGVKNAAVHYYFPSKENLGTSIVKTNTQRFEEMIENMRSLGFDEWHQLETFIKIYTKSNREQKLCIVGSLGPDYNTLSDSTRAELKRMTELIIDWLTATLASGREKKIFSFGENPKIKAFLILSTLVASLQLTRFLDKMEYKNICQAIIEDLKP
jgi:TetR/AcrR family transcriptional regulator, transcriptional repressor for nem operon